MPEARRSPNLPWSRQYPGLSCASTPGKSSPREDIGKNILRDEFDVPTERIGRTFSLILKNARYAGLLTAISGDSYVVLDGGRAAQEQAAAESTSGEANVGEVDDGTKPADTLPPAPTQVLPVRPRSSLSNSKLFVSHGANRTVVDQVKDLLDLGSFEPIVAVEEETAAVPVPDKVFDAMRQCGAGIICVTSEGDHDEDGYTNANPNILMEIGAAYILYEKRVILLWDRRVRVPSNLQGLYRCEFEGDELSWSAGTRLQKALLAIKRGTAPSPSA